MQNQLIPINYNNDRQTTSARALHEFLEVDSNYTTWFKRMAEYGFIGGIDFIPFTEESTGGRPSENHEITIDMAKEIAMLQRTDKGKQARQYFIELEKKWNSPELVMARALKMADVKILELEQAREKDKVKVLFADSVSASRTTILVGELAKIMRQNGVDIGEKRFFKWLRENKYLISRNGSDYNAPTQKSMDLELFTVKETVITHSDGHVSISKTTKINGKGQQYFIGKFLEA